jgi:CheY-like chemotaxis protein
MNFVIPSTASVFVLDDKEDRISWFRARLPRLRYAKTADAALEVLSEEKFDVVFLDHDLSWMDAGFPHRQHGNGKEVARYLATTKFPGMIVIHSHSDQAQAMAKILPKAHIARFGDFSITVSTATPAEHTTRGSGRKLLWHYTVGLHIHSILADGVIRPATAYVPRDQRPVVWFSSNPNWEETANKMIKQDGVLYALNKEETAETWGGLYRIGVLAETAPHNWENLVFLSNIPPAEARALKKVADQDGADPAEWFGTFDPVDSAKWVSVEKLVDGVWQAWSEKEPSRVTKAF